MINPQKSRPARLPDGVIPYRTIGPFDETSLPAGLQQNHSLKDGVWAKLQVAAGEMTFVWMDDEGGNEKVAAPAELIVPPLVPHRVDLTGPVDLRITFYRKP